MHEHQSMVLKFHETFGLTINSVPTIPSVKDRALRVNLILEESGELIEATSQQTAAQVMLATYAYEEHKSAAEIASANLVSAITAIADACADMLYVIYGAALTYGMTISHTEAMVEAYGFGKKTGGVYARGIPVAQVSRINRKAMELCRKFAEATIKEDLTAIEISLTNLIAFTHAVAEAAGIKINPVFTEVQRSNMSKIWEDGTVKRRPEDGKIMKPPTYSPADIIGVLLKQED